MSVERPILQCELCLFFFDSAGARLDPQPTLRGGFFVPEIFRCAHCLTNPPAPAPLPPAAAKPKTPRALPKCKPVLPASTCHRGCPPDTEPVHASLYEPKPVGSTQPEFEALGEGAKAERILLEYFRQHPGEWLPMVHLAELCGSHALHSRIPAVRAMIHEDEDIDNEMRIFKETGKAHSFYRLCPKAESHRLARKRERKHPKRSIEAP